MPAFDPRDPFNPQNDPPDGWPVGRPWPPEGTDREEPGTQEPPGEETAAPTLRPFDPFDPFDPRNEPPPGFPSDRPWPPPGTEDPSRRPDPADPGEDILGAADTGSAVRAASAITTQRARQRKLQADQPPVVRADPLLTVVGDLTGQTGFGPDTPLESDPVTELDPLVPIQPVVPGGLIRPADPLPGDGTVVPPSGGLPPPHTIPFGPGGPDITDPLGPGGPNITDPDDDTVVPPGPGGTGLVPPWEQAGFDSERNWIRAGSPAPPINRGGGLGGVTPGGGVTGDAASEPITTTPPEDEALAALLPATVEPIAPAETTPAAVPGAFLPLEERPAVQFQPIDADKELTDLGMFRPDPERTLSGAGGVNPITGEPSRPLTQQQRAALNIPTGAGTGDPNLLPGNKPIFSGIGSQAGSNPNRGAPVVADTPLGAAGVNPLTGEPSRALTQQQRNALNITAPNLELPGPGKTINENLAPDKATNALIPNRTTSLSPSADDVQQNVSASGNEGNLTAKGALFPRKRKGGVRLGTLTPRSFR